MPRSSRTSDDAARPFKHIEQRLARGAELATTRRDSVRMAGVRRSGTSAEVRLRTAARAAGVRLAPPRRRLPGSPDLVSLKLRLAVFVHGCFWHGHVGCVRATVPKRNRTFWIAKFQRNRARDRAVVTELRQRGFRVLTVWECEVANPISLTRRVRSIARLSTVRPTPARLSGRSRRTKA